MSTFIFAAAMFLTVFAAHAQIQITSLSPTGRLSWTNLVSSVSYPPIYRVMWSSNLNGGLSGFLRVTNQSHAMLTNFPSTTQARLYYRVIWENGQVWNMNFYSQSTLAATGKVYIPTQTFYSASAGRYKMRGVSAPGGPSFFAFVPEGQLGYHQGLPPENNTSLEFLPNPPATIFDISLWIESPIPTSDTWTGHWYESGFSGSVDRQGEFIAQRIPSGQ